jgi:hypothetical protein
MVKIIEVTENASLLTTQNIDYDPGKDLVIYMQNDPMFYRKHLYPVLIDYEDAKKNNQEFNTRSLLPVVGKAINMYCKKYDIVQDPKELFTKAIISQIIRDILSPETEMTRGFNGQNMQ